MDYTDYLLIKAGLLIIAAFVVNLVYSAVTGKSLTAVRRDRASAQQRDSQAD